MSYLYATLGIAMLSGIMAIVQYTNTIINIKTMSTYIQDNYSDSKYQIVDQRYLLIIKNFNQELLINNQPCLYALNKYNSTSEKYYLKDDYILGIESPKTNPNFINSCSITDGIHRIILKRPIENNASYKYFSCILKQSQYCQFEN
tara:strand:- start:10366 stop:10803 length:438 start_codon:yes stop_codon:yes gene_type:complete